MFELAVSTHWNASRHASGEAMCEEILDLGINLLELGYDLRQELVPGVKAMIANGAVKVNSVHNFCPVPRGAPRGHPELYTPGSDDRREREYAVAHIKETLRFAADMGAKVVVCHSGNVSMNRFTMDLVRMAEHGEQFTSAFESLKLKAQIQRDKRAPKQIDALCDSLEKLVPAVRETGVALALENLPTWEAIPTELEAEQLMRRFAGSGIRLWWDVGHAKIRDNLGFINSRRWLERLAPHIAGCHIHAVAPPGRDHLMPPHGEIDYKSMANWIRTDILRVLEPAPGTPTEDMRQGIALIRAAWDPEAAAPETKGTIQ